VLIRSVELLTVLNPCENPRHTVYFKSEDRSPSETQLKTHLVDDGRVVNQRREAWLDLPDVVQLPPHACVPIDPTQLRHALRQKAGWGTWVMWYAYETQTCQYIDQEKPLMANVCEKLLTQQLLFRSTLSFEPVTRPDPRPLHSGRAYITFNPK
jgi:hypothetical protein